MPDESEFLCGDWLWDGTLRELRHYPRRKKGHAETPDSTEQLPSAKAVTLYLWSQQPMSAHTGGGPSGAIMARLDVTYEDGRKLTINESNRECARTLASTIAAASGLTVVEEGAPTGRKGGNLPQRDSMNRLQYDDGRVKSTLDEGMGELRTSKRKRLMGKDSGVYRAADIRRLELAREVSGPMESITVYAIVLPDESEVPVAGYTGFEGWADVEEWRGFTAELARSLGVQWSERAGAG
ncbi:MAG: hypothetical protein ABI559_12085 [Chloroflexota bacterium]